MGAADGEHRGTVTGAGRRRSAQRRWLPGVVVHGSLIARSPGAIGDASGAICGRRAVPTTGRHGTGSDGDDPVWIDDELLGHATVECAVAVGCVVE